MDRRKKGCINEECDRYVHIKKRPYTYKATDKHCSHCGNLLAFVCANCYTEIEDQGPDHRLCLRCEAKKSKRAADIKQKAVTAKAKAKDAGGVIKKTATIAVNKAVVTKDKIAEKSSDIVEKEELQNAIKKVMDNEKVQKAAKEIADEAKEVVKQKADELTDVAVDAVKAKIKK